MERKLSFQEKLIKAFGGEAPKGQIGSTESGKPILSSGAENYSQDFDADDHREAAKVHSDKNEHYQQKQRSFMAGKQKSFNHRLLAVFSSQQAKHSENAKYHQEQAEEVAKQAENKETQKQIKEAEQAEVKKSFAERCSEAFLQKGGPGSGQKGHKTLEQQKTDNEVSSHANRRPYPGEDTTNKPAAEGAKPDFPHVKDLPVHVPGTNDNSKTFTQMWHRGGPENLKGHVSYNAKNDELKPITDHGKKMIQLHETVSHEKLKEHKETILDHFDHSTGRFDTEGLKDDEKKRNALSAFRDHIKKN